MKAAGPFAERATLHQQPIEDNCQEHDIEMMTESSDKFAITQAPQARCDTPVIDERRKAKRLFIPFRGRNCRDLAGYPFPTMWS